MSDRPDFQAAGAAVNRLEDEHYRMARGLPLPNGINLRRAGSDASAIRATLAAAEARITALEQALREIEGVSNSAVVRGLAHSALSGAPREEGTP